MYLLGEAALKTADGLLRKWKWEKLVQGLCFGTTSFQIGRTNGKKAK